jgi:hypothetical protein
MALSRALDAPGEHVIAPGIVPFPRGFAFGDDGRLFLASGIGPNGEGDNSILALTLGERVEPFLLTNDPELSPLDLAVGPNGNIIVSSEHPFGAPDAVTTVREYDAVDGNLVRVFFPAGSAEFRKPRGLRFGPDGKLYCCSGRGGCFRFRDRRVSRGSCALPAPTWTGFGVFPVSNDQRGDFLRTVAPREQTPPASSREGAKCPLRARYRVPVLRKLSFSDRPIGEVHAVLQHQSIGPLIRATGRCYANRSATRPRRRA